MEQLELLIDNVIFIFLKEKDKNEWNTLVELVLNNKYDKILSFTLNNYAKIVLNKNKKNLNEIILLKDYFNSNKVNSINIICNKVNNIYYSNNKQYKKNK